ncbi:MAG: nitroreductase family protein [Halobacteriales archaeon]
MEYYEVIERRHMVRAFRDGPLPADTVERIVRAGLTGPSAGFSQGFEFLVLEAEADRTRFWETNEHNPQPESVRRAPLVVVPFASKEAYLDRYAEPDKGWTDRDEDRWPVPYWYVDTGMAALLMLLAAVEEGLGALLFGLPREDWTALRSTFDVPEAFDPIGALAIGPPGEDEVVSSADRRDRKPLAEVVHAGRWDRPYEA